MKDYDQAELNKFKLKYILRNYSEYSPWEKQFISSISIEIDIGNKLTDKQQEEFDKIFEK
jgi:hypothetical protein